MTYQAEHNIVGQGWTRCAAAFATKEEAARSELIRFRMKELPNFVRIVETGATQLYAIAPNGEVRRAFKEGE